MNRLAMCLAAVSLVAVAAPAQAIELYATSPGRVVVTTPNVYVPPPRVLVLSQPPPVIRTVYTSPVVTTTTVVTEPAVDVVSDDPQFSRRFYRQALANEILLRPIGNTVYFMPPYVISPEQCAFLVARATAALEAALHP